jgi:predicted nucleic acid-binding protein
VNIVVDTNIIFSAILNPSGKISDLLLDPADHFTFFAPDYMIGELDRHHGKLISISKLPEPDILFLKKMVVSKLTLVDLDTIDQDTWTKAISLVAHIDEFDAPFLALSLKMDSYLWTGDKKLINGLKDLGYNRVIDTDALMVLRNALD